MRSSFRPSSPPKSDSDAPPSAGHYDQEFLYHLYRGSELLQDNAVDEAKAELERALALQPRDTEGQGLLGVVYFRLGMYPLAIEIFEQLDRTCPTEVTPKINLALCYLKTGQSEAALDRLEAVVQRAPKHKRAWGYLGLVYQRFGEFEKARVAFDRAGHPKMAARMALLISQVEGNPREELPEIDEAAFSQRGSLRPSFGSVQGRTTIPPPPRISSTDPALAAVPSPHLPELDAAQESMRGVPSLRDSVLRDSVAPPVSTRGVASVAPPQSNVGHPGLVPTPSSSRLLLPEPVTRVVREAEVVFPENPRVAMHTDGSVLARIDTSFAVRPQWIGALSYHRAPFSTQTLRRRSATSTSGEPLGGVAPIVSLVGSGRLLISPHPDTRLLLFTVDREPLYLRESHLIGFQPQVSYESGRLDPHASTDIVTKLGGAGAVIAYSRGRLATLPVTADAPLCIRSAQVLGWLGRLLPRVIPVAEAPAGLTAMLGFSGHGSVLIDMS